MATKVVVLRADMTPEEQQKALEGAFKGGFHVVAQIDVEAKEDRSSFGTGDYRRTIKVTHVVLTDDDLIDDIP